MLPYIKLFSDASAAIDLLSDTEAGRLLKAILHYANDQGTELTGQEKLVFVMLKAQFDRDAAAYQDFIDRQRTNGQKGGRPKKPTGFSKNPPVSEKNPENPPVFLKTQKTQEEEKEEDKDKEKEEEEDTPIIPNRPFAPDEELIARQAEQDEVLDYADYVGLKNTEYNRNELMELLRIHGKDRLLYALGEAGRLEKLSVGYIKGVLTGKRKPVYNDDDDLPLIC